MPKSGTQSRPTTWVRDAPYVRGVVNRVDPRHIPDDAAAELLNVDLTDPSRPRKRDGYSAIAVGSLGLDSVDARIDGLGYLNVSSSAKLVVIATKSGIYYISSIGASSGWSKATGSFNVDTSDAKMLQGNFQLWILPGSSQNVRVLQTDGTLVDTGDTNESPPRGAQDIAYMFRSIFFIKDQTLYWSKLLPAESDLTPTPAAFDRTLQSLTLSPPFGGTPVALQPWNQQSLMVFYDEAIQEVIVADDRALSVVNVVEPRIGCASRDSVLVVGSEMYFADQYAQIRKLRQTISGTMQGVGEGGEPLSWPISREIPDRVTKGYYHRIRLELHGDEIHVFYPRDGSQESNARMIFDTSRQRWVGPHVFADAFSKVLSSNIRGLGEDLYVSGAAKAKVYRLNDGSFSDDGVPIKYRETTRAYDLGVPERDKTPKHIEIEIFGSAGAKARVYVRGDEQSDFSLVEEREVQSNADGSFPIVEAGEPGSVWPIAELGE